MKMEIQSLISISGAFETQYIISNLFKNEELSSMSNIMTFLVLNFNMNDNLQIEVFIRV